MNPREEKEKNRVIGIGNVIGHQSSSKNEIKINVGTGEKKTGTMWIRLFAFLIGVACLLKLFSLFFQPLNDLDVGSLIEILLIAIIAILGVVGVLRPEDIANIFLKLFTKD